MMVDDDNDEPRRMSARHRGECAECLKSIEPGDPIVWQPALGPARAKTFCASCGEEILEA